MHFYLYAHVYIYIHTIYMCLPFSVHLQRVGENHILHVASKFTIRTAPGSRVHELDAVVIRIMSFSCRTMTAFFYPPTAPQKRTQDPNRVAGGKWVMPPFFSARV
jgi:hypothetical protein